VYTLRQSLQVAAAACSVAGLVAMIGLAHGREDDDGLAWAIVHPSGSTSMSGSSTDWKAIGRLQRSTTKAVLYGRLGQKRFLISDAVMIGRVAELMEPQEKIGKQMETLGRESERLSAAESELDDQESALEDRRDEITEELDRLQERVAELAESSVDRSRQEDLRRRRAALRDELRRIDTPLDELRTRMDSLEAEEKRLSRREEDLDREHERLYQIAQREIRVVLNDAVARGLTTPLPR